MRPFSFYTVNLEMFNREAYLSQTEIVKNYKVSVKKFKELLKEHNIPVVSNKADLGLYSVNTVYILKEDIGKLNLDKRN